MRTFLIVLSLILSDGFCDVSHVFFGEVNDLYKVPAFPTPTTTAQPLLPEIIINRKFKDFGYIYQKPQETYIPPQNIPSQPPEEHIPSNPFPQNPPSTPIPFPPIVVGDPTIPTDGNPPSEGYLPPHTDVKPDILISYPNEHSQGSNDGYHYDRPTPTSTQSPIIFPPESDISETPDFQPGYSYNTPQPPSAGYLPPVTDRAGKDLFGTQLKNPIRLQITEMRCMLSQAGYFKSVLKVDSFLAATPVVDSDSIDTRCDLRLFRSHLIITIASEDFQRCGVSHCADNNLCLRLRFPLIRGMKTASDSVLTLQCKTQDRIVSKTHALKMAIALNGVQGRNIGAYVQGGNQQPFRTHIELLRKTPSGFTRTLEPNGIVQLGEELQLRAHVHAGDGWNYTRLSDVQLQRVSPSGEVLNSAVLVTSSGCINPSMRTICPTPPIFEPPLGHRLSFKAVMFQGMRSGDEMLMTIKIAGCMEQTDCFINVSNCENSHNTISRFRRNAKQNSTGYSDISTISFRVEIPKMTQSPEYQKVRAAHFVVGGIIAFISLLSLIAIIVYFKLNK